MNAGELFVNIGFKGVEKAVEGLKKIKDGLKGIADSSFETKAAIVGAVYALERFTIGAAQHGTTLQQFRRETGLSIDQIQRWQYAMMQSGVAADDVQSSIEGVQDTIGKMAIGKGQPNGWAMVNEKVGIDPEKAKTDIYYLMDKLRRYAQTEKDVTQRNIVLESFGLSRKMIGGMASNTTDLSKINKSELLSDKTVSQLDKINIAWKNFWYTIDLFRSRLVASFGTPLLKFAKEIFSYINKPDVINGLKSALIWLGDFITKTLFPILGELWKKIQKAFTRENIEWFLTSIKSIFDAIVKVASVIGGMFGNSPKSADGKSAPLNAGAAPSLWDMLKGFNTLFSNPSHNATPDQINKAPTLNNLWDHVKDLNKSFSVPPANERRGSGPLSLNVNVQNHGVAGAGGINQTIGTAVNYAFRQMQSFQVS